MAVSQTCHGILSGAAWAGSHVEYWADAHAPGLGKEYTRQPFPHPIPAISNRFGVSLVPQLEKRFLANIKPGDVAYLWPGTSEKVYRGAKEKGAIVVAERINCSLRLQRQLMTRAYGVLGWPRNLSYKEESARREMEELSLADLVTTGNPTSAKSYQELGVPEERILSLTYGWDPARFSLPNTRPANADDVRLLFVGRGCVRKGLPWVLRMWEKAQVQGELVLAGRLDEEVRDGCSGLLSREDVVELGFVESVERVYADSDIFVFPSHEEGGPQVTIEALGCGLPCITSPIAAGDIIRHGVEGFVIEPCDVEAGAKAIARLSSDVNLRHKMSEAARDRAKKYTWDKVGARFARAVSERIRELGLSNT